MESKDYDDYIVIEIREGMEHELYIQQDVSDTRNLMYPAYAAARKSLRGIVMILGSKPPVSGSTRR